MRGSMTLSIYIKGYYGQSIFLESCRHQCIMFYIIVNTIYNLSIINDIQRFVMRVSLALLNAEGTLISFMPTRSDRVGHIPKAITVENWTRIVQSLRPLASDRHRQTF